MSLLSSRQVGTLAQARRHRHRHRHRLLSINDSIRLSFRNLVAVNLAFMSKWPTLIGYVASYNSQLALPEDSRTFSLDSRSFSSRLFSATPEFVPFQSESRNSIIIEHINQRACQR